MSNFLGLALLLLWALTSHAFVRDSVRVEASLLVDTSIVEVQEVFRLWSSYLNSRPDSSYDNPHWSKRERSKLKHFDVTGLGIYHVVTNDIRLWKPLVLSIDRIESGYEIRTAYVSPSDKHPQQQIWAIHAVHAVKESGAWVLANAKPWLSAPNHIHG